MKGPEREQEDQVNFKNETAMVSSNATPPRSRQTSRDSSFATVTSRSSLVTSRSISAPAAARSSAAVASAWSRGNPAASSLRAAASASKVVAVVVTWLSPFRALYIGVRSSPWTGDGSSITGWRRRFSQFPAKPAGRLLTGAGSGDEVELGELPFDGHVRFGAALRSLGGANADSEIAHQDGEEHHLRNGGTDDRGEDGEEVGPLHRDSSSVRLYTRAGACLGGMGGRLRLLAGRRRLLIKGGCISGLSRKGEMEELPLDVSDARGEAGEVLAELCYVASDFTDVSANLANGPVQHQEKSNGDSHDGERGAHSGADDGNEVRSLHRSFSSVRLYTRAWSCLPLLLVLGAEGALAQDSVAEHMRSHALRYAGMIERAYARLHGFIRNRSAAAVSWTGAAVPPSSTGWEGVWTDVGIRARYCDDVLLVYMGAAEPKGVGPQHREIQHARRKYLPAGESGLGRPSLLWLEAGSVADIHGTVTALPACMSSSYTEALPSGRAALSSVVVDPWTDTRERVSYENRVRACPAGEHGEIRERRTVTQEVNAKGVDVGSPVYGAWTEVAGSWCRTDYTRYEPVTQSCSWHQGEPFNRTMTGTETWRIPIAVTADPNNPTNRIETPGTPEFVATTCWDGPPPVPPVPTTTEVAVTETRTASCPAGFTGTIELERTKTTATTTYPWGAAPLVSVHYTNWREVNNDCVRDDPPDDYGGTDSDDSDAPAPSVPGDSSTEAGPTGGAFSDGGGTESGNPGIGSICFSADARVRLPDGVDVAIGEIELGERVVVPSGLARVVAVYRDDREKYWVSIDGEAPFFTASHPVVTERGTVRGGELQAGDRLRTLSGTFRTVVRVDLVKLRKVNVNIETEGHAPYFVDGVLFGSYPSTKERDK